MAEVNATDVIDRLAAKVGKLEMEVIVQTLRAEQAEEKLALSSTL